MIKKIKNQVRIVKGLIYENIYANVWHDTIKGIKWLGGETSFSPGRSAVGYNYLYVMTRILNEFTPKTVLDIGLGISSTLISEYFRYFEGIDKDNHYSHIVLEHDQDWIDFYTRQHKLASCTSILKQDLVIKQHNGESYYAYKDISKDISGKKFDVISIDAPFGFGIKNKNGKQSYSRRDIIDFLPDILNEDFVILVDDCNRIGEMNTVVDIMSVLEQKGIECHKGVYYGENNICVIVNNKNRFLCSL